MIIEGAISIKAAINAGNRKVDKVYINRDKKTKDFNYLRKIIKNNNIELVESTKDDLDKIALGKTYGGILAEVSNRYMNDFDDSDIFFLDGIEDPFNLGYACRTLYAFGVKNVLLSNRDYSNMEAQLLKSSAGAYDLLNIKIVKDSINEVKEYKDKGYYLYALYRGDEAKDVFNVKFNNKSLFILGGEKRGISSQLLDLCDEYLYIPYGSDFRNALNACGALDVLATLLFAQRKK